MKFVLTTPYWLESLASKELKKLWYNPVSSTWMVFFDWKKESIPNVNINSRIWNKLYLEIWSWSVEKFQDLFELVDSVDWKKYILSGQSVLVNANTKNSTITSIPAIQKAGKKWIIKSLVWENYMKEEADSQQIEVFIFIDNNVWKIYLNTTWEWLFKRWYKKHFSEAWLKENVAAWLILLAWWKFSDSFYDLFCGAWTIPIEAAMIAKNIAPGLFRNFAFESFDWFDEALLKKEKELAESRIFTRNYNIFGFDVDSSMIDFAKKNAKNAGVEADISFAKKDFLEFDCSKLQWTILSNPPYGIRLTNFDTKNLHKKLARCLIDNNNVNWWFFTVYEDDFLNNSSFKKKKMFNWQQKAWFYKKN